MYAYCNSAQCHSADHNSVQCHSAECRGATIKIYLVDCVSVKSSSCSNFSNKRRLHSFFRTKIVFFRTKNIFFFEQKSFFFLLFGIENILWTVVLGIGIRHLNNLKWVWFAILYGATTLSLMTLNIMGSFTTRNINDTQHKQSELQYYVTLYWVSRFFYCYAECHYAGCRYGECRYA